MTFDILDSNLFILLLTLLIGAVSAYISYRCTKKIRFFDVYINNKIEAYNNFYDALLKFQKGEIGQNEFATALYKAGIFTSRDAYAFMCTFWATIIHEPCDNELFSRQAATMVALLREDIDKCCKFKFR